ncbi:MAG: DUF2306 domain-containing protein [Thalassobaculaceae bacterium]
MNWQALWDSGTVVALHALVALFALVAGAIQLAAPKGTIGHRVLGFAWVSAMAAVAASSFWIHTFRWVGPFSAIHLLSVLVLYTLVYSILSVRRGNIRAHRSSMVSLYVLALLLTGAFTLLPGRAMHAVVFGS